MLKKIRFNVTEVKDRCHPTVSLWDGSEELQQFIYGNLGSGALAMDVAELMAKELYASIIACGGQVAMDYKNSNETIRHTKEFTQ